MLLVLALHMRLDGTGAFPSEATLAAETGLSERAVGKHLKIASEDGWISRKLWRDKGKNWAGYRYSATLPKGLHAPEPRSVPSQHAPEPHTNGTEPECNMVRNDVPTNSALNTTLNTTPNVVQRKMPEGPGWEEFQALCKQMGLH